MEFSKLWHGFVKIDTWISLSYYLEFLKMIYGFVKVFLFISRPLQNNTKLKFYQDFKAFRASALN